MQPPDTTNRHVDGAGQGPAVRFPLAARALHRTAVAATPGQSIPAGLDGSAATTAQPALRARTRNNWALYLFVFLLPLQNIHTGYLPNLGGGLNFLNVGFATSLIGAWILHGRLAPNEPVNRWVVVYAAYAVVSLLVGFQYVSNTELHYKVLKDMLLGLSVLYLVQLSVHDWTGVRRMVLATLLPLPYILKVTVNQHMSVSSWHYSDDLRIKGTFPLLGANEFASFCVTMAVFVFALLLATRTTRRWRIALIASLACMLVGVLYAYSRTAYFALPVGMAGVIIAWRGRWKMVLPVLLLAAFAPAWMPSSVVERFDSTSVDADTRDESTEMRFEYWQIAWDNFLAHPVVGTGFQSFRHPEINPHRTDTHNFFIRTLTEGGIVGALVLLGLLLSILRTARREIAAAPPGSWRYGLALGLFGAWMALIVNNLFGDRFTYYPMIACFWVFTALVLKGRHLPPETAPR